MQRLAAIILLPLTLLILAACQCTGCASANGEPPEDPSTPILPPTSIGIAPYAIQSEHFPCQDLWNSLSEVTAYNISYLYNTFGTSNACIRKFFYDPRLQSVQIHLINEVCVRNKNCGDYEVYSDLTIQEVNLLAEKEEGWFKNRLIKYVQPLSDQITNLLSVRPDLTCNISPGLESNTSPEGMRHIISWLRPLFPQCTFTYNPLFPSTHDLYASADFYEQHNPDVSLPTPCIFNNDGVSFTFENYGSLYPRNIESSRVPELVHRFRNCEKTFFWHHSYNCINPRKFIDPRNRKCDEVVPFKLLTNEIVKLQNGNL